MLVMIDSFTCIVFLPYRHEHFLRHFCCLILQAEQELMWNSRRTRRNGMEVAPDAFRLSGYSSSFPSLIKILSNVLQIIWLNLWMEVFAPWPKHYLWLVNISKCRLQNATKYMTFLIKRFLFIVSESLQYFPIDIPYLKN